MSQLKDRKHSDLIRKLPKSKIDLREFSRKLHTDAGQKKIQVIPVECADYIDDKCENNCTVTVSEIVHYL